jgi:hypothetical protein
MSHGFAIESTTSTPKTARLWRSCLKTQTECAAGFTEAVSILDQHVAPALQRLSHNSIGGIFKGHVPPGLQRLSQNSRGGEAWSSAIGAEQQSPGQGREAAVALGHDAEAKSPEGAAQARKTCAALAGLGSHPSFPGAYAPGSAASRFQRSRRQVLRQPLEDSLFTSRGLRPGLCCIARSALKS